MPTSFISVVIPTCQREDMLRLCLERLTPGAQTLDKSVYEVIVSDDGQENTAEQLVKVAFPWAKWIKGPGRGPAANRNNGARNAKGEWLVFLDDDVLPDGLLLEEYKNAIGKYPKMLAFEGAILPDDWELLKKDMAECPVNTSGGCFWSANICVNKSLFDSIHGFDEKFETAAHEDQDIYNRLLKRGFVVVYAADAKVIHPVRFVKLRQKIRRSHRALRSYFHYKKTDGIYNVNLFLNQFCFHIRCIFNSALKYKPKSVIYHIYVVMICLPIEIIFRRYK